MWASFLMNIFYIYLFHYNIGNLPWSYWTRIPLHFFDIGVGFGFALHMFGFGVGNLRFGLPFFSLSLALGLVSYGGGFL